MTWSLRAGLRAATAAFLGLTLCFCVQPRAAEAQLQEQQQVVRACGAITLALPLSEAVPLFRTERNIELIMRSAGGTNTGLDALCERNVNVALCSRELTATDRADNPEMQLVETPVGVQVLILAVSRDVWAGGVRVLSAEQMRGIYEGAIKNWKEVGGPDLKIRLFMQESGRGIWELFAQWLYEDVKRAPLWKGTTVKNMQETRNMLEFTPGAVSVISPGFVDNKDIFPLSIRGDSGKVIDPVFENLFNKTYPLFRPLSFVTADRPTGAVKVIVDFMVGERGQALIKQYGYITLADLETARQKVSQKSEKN